MTANSHKCGSTGCSIDCYCEAVQIDVFGWGDYTIFINSTASLDRYIYENNFTIFDLHRNLLSKEIINSCDEPYQFRVDRQKMNTSFIVVVTSEFRNPQDEYTIVVNGPNVVVMKHIDIPAIIRWNYTSSLNDISPLHDHHNCALLAYYYEAIEINVTQSGYYTLSSITNLDSYGYLYKDYFTSFNPEETSVNYNTDGCQDGNFKITEYLQSNTTYILIVTTHMMEKFAQGPFSVIIRGHHNITMKRTGRF